jgi:RimJ/RimL family protein N-acetyltransferase
LHVRDGSLELRAWQEDDVPAIHAACQDPEIQKWIPLIPRPYTLEDARAFVTDEIGLGPYQFAIVEDGRVVGSIGMHVEERWGRGHIGYWCAREARGRGIVTRALRLLCRYGFEELGLARLELITDPDNHASQRVAEKVGFRREGILRAHLRHPDGRVRDSVMFSLLPGEVRD